MTTGQIVILAILGVIAIIGYFGTAYRLNWDKHPISGILYLALPVGIALISLTLLGINLNDKANLEKQTKKISSIQKNK